MSNYPYVPGAAVPNNLLMQAAVSAASSDRPENFIGRIVMPDTRVETFSFSAPMYGNEGLEAADDDLVGPGTDYKELMLEEGYYDESIGSHARKAVIYQEAIARAEEARRYAQVFGGNVSDQVFDLKVRHTNAILQRIDRHNEALIALLMTTSANYRNTHVFATLNVRTSDQIRETILAASNLIEADAGAPANSVFFGVGARQGAEQNATFLDLLPENAPKVLTTETLRAFLNLPGQGGTVMFPTARIKSKAKAASTPIWDEFIWVGRVVADQDGRNETFGRNYWKPDHRNGQRVYVNEIMVGVQENVEIGAITHYKPGILNKDFGVLIPTTSV